MLGPLGTTDPAREAGLVRDPFLQIPNLKAFQSKHLRKASGEVGLPNCKKVLQPATRFALTTISYGDGFSPQRTPRTPSKVQRMTRTAIGAACAAIPQHVRLLKHQCVFSNSE